MPLLVWLDRPVGVRLWRVLKRSVKDRGRTRPDMADDCPERLRLLPEFIRYIWTTRRSQRAKIARLAETASCPVVRLNTDTDVADFVRNARLLFATGSV